MTVPFDGAVGKDLIARSCPKACPGALAAISCVTSWILNSSFGGCAMTWHHCGRIFWWTTGWLYLGGP